MEVILREHVDNLGRRGDIVKVADGYARNYLLPRKLALLATDGNRKHVERERRIMETREAEEKSQAEGDCNAARERRDRDRAPGRRHRAVVRLGDRRRHRRVSEGQGLRSRSTQADPARADQDAGQHNVPLKLHREVTVPLTVQVVREGAEPQA
jgi:large subunit ribosomal protein L9